MAPLRPVAVANVKADVASSQRAEYPVDLHQDGIEASASRLKVLKGYMEFGRIDAPGMRGSR
jgi:hypothetical protein